MPVRKHKLHADHPDAPGEHVIAEASPKGTLTPRDHAGLHSHRAIRTLTINRLKAESLDFLADWKELRDLRLYGCTIDDLGALSRLKKLRKLWYNSDRRKGVDLAFLSSLAALEELGVLHVPHLRSFPDLSACRRLRVLEIVGCKRLVDLDAVPRIPKLESFGIVGTSLMPADLEPIMAMKSLKAMSAAFGSARRDAEFDALLERHGLQYG